jgi:hypothetical protein
MRRAFSNDLYSTGEGFCLTNYQALFNSRSVFRRDLRPEAIIFDDAHVAEKIIRDSFTIKISKSDLAEIYARATELLRPHFVSLHRTEYFDRIVAGDSSYYVIAAPPNTVVSLDRDGSLLKLLQKAEQQDSTIGFALGHLADRLDRCSIFLSQHAVEICPAFLPSKRLPFLSDNEIRRLYLSATLTSEVDFCRAFGMRPAVRIEPESDAGIGERLIVLAEKQSLRDGAAKSVTEEAIASVLVTQNKLLISVPNYASAKKYQTLVKPPNVDDFSEKLDEFRRRTTPGFFLLVGRVDGIDLPHATCRVMLADGLPAGFSLSEEYLYDFLEMRNSFAAKLANRITQLFGRTNRGRNDYSVIFASDRRLVNWLSAPRNVALLPELLRKQLLLGKSLVKQFKVQDIQMFPGLVKQVIDRDMGWLKYYKESVGGLDVGEDQRQQAAENDKILTEAALAESEFAAQMWDGNSALAREALGNVVDRVVVADRRLAGWYNIQIGHTFELENDGESAAKQYSQARARIHHILSLPHPASTQSVANKQQAKNKFHRELLEIFQNDIRVQNDHIKRYERLIMPLFDEQASVGQQEEALRYFGEVLGFEATRPEQDDDNDSTLDVLWNSTTTHQAILFELKTKKNPDQAINKGDVGQGFNHLQNIAEAHTDTTALGLIFIRPSETCTKDASPSDNMWVTQLGRFRSLYEDTIQMLFALQRMQPLQRYGEIDSLVARAEWQPELFFKDCAESGSST